MEKFANFGIVGGEQIEVEEFKVIKKPKIYFQVRVNGVCVEKTLNGPLKHGNLAIRLGSTRLVIDDNGMLWIPAIQPLFEVDLKTADILKNMDYEALFTAVGREIAEHAEPSLAPKDLISGQTVTAPAVGIDFFFDQGQVEKKLVKSRKPRRVFFTCLAPIPGDCFTAKSADGQFTISCGLNAYSYGHLQIRSFGWHNLAAWTYVTNQQITETFQDLAQQLAATVPTDANLTSWRLKPVTNYELLG